MRSPYQDLVKAVERCRQAQDRLPGLDHHTIRERLDVLAGIAQTAADAVGLDPTLVDDETGRLRLVDLFVELTRHLHVRLDPRRQVPERFATRDTEETDALYTRAVTLGRRIPAGVPRADHATVEGCREISESRLAARHDTLTRLAKSLRQVSADAALPHPTPRLAELVDLAAELDRHATELAVVRQADLDRQAHLLRPTDQEKYSHD